MGKSIGIDLGTTNSVMYHMHTRPELILNGNNERLTPSVVAWKKGRKIGETFYVGKTAETMAGRVKENYLYSVKRLIGRGLDDPDVQEMVSGKRKVSYGIIESPNGEKDAVRVVLGGKSYMPREISAHVLRKLKEDAEKRLGVEVDSAVITVPAYFNDRQRFATREAGRLAGLKVKRIMDEPTAAAYAYGISHANEDDQMIMVFDLGGGTFDVSVLMIGGGLFQPIAVKGDMWLGGDDFDRLIVDWVLQKLEHDAPHLGEAQKKQLRSDMRYEARQVKEILSTQEMAEFMFAADSLEDEDGLPLEIEYELTRQEFNHILIHSVDRSTAIVDAALKVRGLSKDDIDKVLMVGGSSSIPAFQEAMEDYFGPGKVERNLDPMTCVAEGAAILARDLTTVWCPECGHDNPEDLDACEKCSAGLSVAQAGASQSGDDDQAYAGVTAFPYGIEAEGNKFVEIISEGTTFPITEPYVEKFHTLHEDQRIIKMPVLANPEGVSEATACDFMGDLWFTDLPGGLPAQSPIEVSMKIDSDGIFTIGCRVPGTDWRRDIELKHDGWQGPVLNAAMEAHMEVLNQGVVGEKAQKLQEHLEGIQNALDDDDREAAQQHRQAIEDIREEAQKPPVDEGVPWRLALENTVAMAENNLEPVREIMSSDSAFQAADRWLQQAKRALRENDQQTGEGLSQKGLQLLMEVNLVRELIIADVVSIVLKDVNPALASEVEQSRQELLTCLRNKDVLRMTRLAEDFKAVLARGMAEAEPILHAGGDSVPDGASGSAMQALGALLGH